MAYIYTNGAWTSYDSPKYGVNTTIFTTYPFTIKSPTTPVNATIYGNMVQTGTPTPAAPITPAECGDLETDGAKAGQYKIPILNNSTTTTVYLGEVQSTRMIKKLVLIGDDTETYISSYSGDNRFFTYTLGSRGRNFIISTHFTTANINSTSTDVGVRILDGTSLRIRPENVRDMTVDIFKAWLQQQYAAGTPVCVWYILSTPETAVVNEPIRKIDDYADTVTTSIPVTINSDTVDVSTILKPSAVAAPSLSWGTGDDYKYSSGAWS